MTTKQEIFDLVWKRANEMEVPAVNEKDRCMYRSPNGPCLIGSLIKDEFYNEGLEHKGASQPHVISALSKSGIDFIDEYFFDELQACHDHYKYDTDSFKSNMLNDLRQVAINHNLVVSE